MNAGFYKIKDGQMLYAENYVEGQGYVLVAENKDSYEYPVDGWYWFNSEEGVSMPVDLQAIYDVAAAAFGSLSAGKQALWEPVRVAVSKAIMTGDMAKALDILSTVPVIYEGAEVDRQMFLNLFNP